MAKKRYITEQLLIILPYSLANSIDSVIDYFTKLKKEYEEKGFSDIELEVCWGKDLYNLETQEFRVYGTRLETDKDLEKRLTEKKQAKERAKKLCAQKKARKEQKDRKEYERLKAKFEGDKQ